MMYGCATDAMQHSSKCDGVDYSHDILQVLVVSHSKTVIPTMPYTVIESNVVLLPKSAAQIILAAYARLLQCYPRVVHTAFVPELLYLRPQ
jgi:hypothetical protein